MNTGRTRFKRGHIPHNKGSGITRICEVCKEVFYKHGRVRQYKYCSRKCYFSTRLGKNHPNWAGDNIGYAGVHDWITAEKGQPKICERCGDNNAKRYEWANISGHYKRELSDWKRLCKSCHVKIDRYGYKWDV